MQKIIIFTLFLCFSGIGLQAVDPKDEVVSRTVTAVKKTYEEEPAKFWTTTHFVLDGADIITRPLLPKLAALIEIPRFIALFQSNKHLLVDVRDPNPQLKAKLAKIIGAHTAFDIIEILAYTGILDNSYIKMLAPLGGAVCVGAWIYEMTKSKDISKQE